MLTEIESEAQDLLNGASKAIEKDESLLTIQTMPEVSHALINLIQMHRGSPYTLAACAFLLGTYMGLQYHDMQIFTGE
jgi:hypothetical protein